jgi:formylglycine-generating enzyme required for sulfatase activity
MNHRAAGCFVIVLCLVALIAATPVAAAEGRPTERVSPPPKCNPKAAVWRTREPPANPQQGDIWVNPKNGMEMVYIAPGEFILGTSGAQIDAWLKEYPDGEREWFYDEQPQCRVNLEGYWIGRTEVTNAQYLRFVQATGHRAPEHWKGGQIPSGLESFPVVFVDWGDASAYCKWAEARLPTEPEWEKAARGGDGRTFPWGFRWDENKCRNFAIVPGGGTYAIEEEGSRPWRDWVPSHDSVREGPAAVGAYPAGASPYGCLDMAGNAREWCADWYDDEAYLRYVRGDLTPPKTGDLKVVRGGSWFDGHSRLFRCAFRSPIRFGFLSTPHHCDHDIGFRCARHASP